MNAPNRVNFRISSDEIERTIRLDLLDLPGPEFDINVTQSWSKRPKMLAPTKAVITVRRSETLIQVTGFLRLKDGGVGVTGDSWTFRQRVDTSIGTYFGETALIKAPAWVQALVADLGL